METGLFRLPDQYCLARGRHCGYRITGLVLVDLLGIRRRIYRAGVVVYRPASREKEETRSAVTVRIMEQNLKNPPVTSTKLCERLVYKA